MVSLTKAAAVFVNRSSAIPQGAALERAFVEVCPNRRGWKRRKRGKRDISVKYKGLSSV